jgi:hypothetical protein
MTSKLTELAQERKTEGLQMSSREAYQWLLTKIAALRNPSVIAKTIKDEELRPGRFKLGQLYYFYYDPKGKDDLPYYDKFPLVLTLEKYQDGFLGLNLHYLPIKYRVAFIGKLMPYAVPGKDDEIKRMRITYDILVASKRLREFRPCIKRYLTPHIKSKLLAVQPDEWDTAIMLPVHQFKGAKPAEVWKDSVEEIKRN